MATADEYASWIVANADKKGTPEFETVAKAYQDARRQQVKPQDPTQGMSGPEKFFAGAGKAFVDIGRGAGQLVGLVDQKDIDEDRRLSEPLMKTSAGMAGNVVGNLAAFAPTAFVPGANTYLGSAAIGAGAGLLNPVGSDDSSVLAGKAKSMVLGGVTSPIALVVSRGIGGAAQGFKAIAEPFYESGRSNIIARTLARFSDDPAALAAKARAANPPIAGVQQTLAEATMDPGAATLQRAAQSISPDMAIDLQNRQLANNSALVRALRGIGGTDTDMANAIASRKQAVTPLYRAADLSTENVDPSRVVGLIDRMIDKNPANKSLVSSLGEIRDSLFDDGVLRGKPTHIKSAYDNIKTLLDNEENKFVKRELSVVKNALGHQMNKAVPEFRQAERTFAGMSEPINRMEVGRELLSRGGSKALNALDDPTLFNEKFASAISDGGESLVKSATGFRGKPLSKVLSQDDMALIEGVRKQLQAQTAAANLARSVGSNTAQNLASQNLMRQLAGPLGFSESVLSGPLAQSVLRPLSWAASATEPTLQKKLAEALLDPKMAASFLEKVQPNKAAKLIAELQRYVPMGSIASERYAENE